MGCKLGGTHRTLRVVIGITLIVVGFLDLIDSGIPGNVLGVIGIIAVGTGLWGRCPACRLLGRRS